MVETSRKHVTILFAHPPHPFFARPAKPVDHVKLPVSVHRLHSGTHPDPGTYLRYDCDQRWGLAATGGRGVGGRGAPSGEQGRSSTARRSRDCSTTIPVCRSGAATTAATRCSTHACQGPLRHVSCRPSAVQHATRRRQAATEGGDGQGHTRATAAAAGPPPPPALHECA